MPPTPAVVAATALVVLAGWAGPAPAGAVEDGNLASAAKLRLRLHVQNNLNAGSKGHFEVLLSSSPGAAAAGAAPAGVWTPLQTSASGGFREGAWFSQELAAPASPPATLGLRALGQDGLGLDRIILGDTELTEGLPLWLDFPCEPPSPYCSKQHFWALPVPTTTSATTSATRTRTSTVTTRTPTTTRSSTTGTATATRTWTATSSTGTATASWTWTATSSTTSTTSSTTAGGAPVELSAGDQLAAVATPPAFYDEVESLLKLDANLTENGHVRLSEYEGKVARVITEFVELKPPSIVTCSLEWESATVARATLLFRVDPDSEVSALDIRDVLLDPSLRGVLNGMLAEVGSTKGIEYASAHVTHCRIGALFCCVDAVVYGIVHNAGVIVAYKHCFAFALALVAWIVFVFLRFRWLRHSAQDGHCREAERAQLLMPLVAVGAVFQALVSITGSLHKYNLVSWRCSKDDASLSAAAPGSLGCPVALWPAVSEVILFGCLALVIATSVLCWWRQQLLADCDIGDPPEDWPWRPVTPLESLIRRSHMLGFLEVRPSDKADSLEHGLLIVNDVAISFAVVLTSFFFLQQYALPGLLVAWYPYKLIYELLAGFLLRELFRKVALGVLTGYSQRVFVLLGICTFLAVDIWLWDIVFETLAYVAPHASVSSVVRILDIALGSGILNYFLGQLCVGFSLRWFSVYVYEPHLRYWLRRRVYVTEPDQMDRVRAIVAAPGSCWEISGTPTLLSEDGRSRARTGSATSSAASSAFSFFGAGNEGQADDEDDENSSQVDQSPSINRPLLVQLSRTDSCCLVKLISVLDVIFSVHKDLPVEPREKRAAMMAGCGNSVGCSPVDDDLEEMMMMSQPTCSARTPSSSAAGEEDTDDFDDDDSDSDDDDSAGSTSPLSASRGRTR